MHGDTRIDDYFWLRDRNDPDVLAHLEAENAYTRAVTGATAQLERALYDEMLAHVKETDASAPYRRHGYDYYRRTEAGRQYPVWCRRAIEPAADEEIVLDLNELAVGHPFLGLGAFVVSDDGTLLAYSIDVTGYRQYVLQVRDLRTGHDVPTRIERVAGVAWLADNRTLVYVTEDAQTKRADTVWRYELDAAQAEQLYHEADDLFDLGLSRTRDGALIVIASEAKDTSEARWLDATDATSVPCLFAARVDGVRYELDGRAGTLYIRTNEGAPDFRVFATPVDRPQRSAWTEIIAARPGTTITAVELFADFLVIAGRRAGLASLELLRDGATTLEPLAFAEDNYVVHVGDNHEFATSAFRYTYESLVTPPSIYDLDVATMRSTLVKQLEVPGYVPQDYVAERRFIAAADGTPIPVSLVRRRDSAPRGPAPLLLYAYGSYGYSIDPTFAATRLVLLDRGVTFAIAHVRGGGEYGEAWRLAGNLFNKRTTFTDFIDCATGLIAAGDTTPEQLAVQGGSAGGLLMGAVANMRSDLFAAVVAQVPFVDVLTTMLDASLPLTTGEYREWGNPNDVAAYAYMRTYSPVDNVVSQPYPAMLIEVALNDSQVPYWEGVKLAAKLRRATTSSKPILVKVNMGAGHGGASGRYDALAERAFDYAFVLSQIGIRTEERRADVSACRVVPTGG
jgi:oligopeptidase B